MVKDNLRAGITLTTIAVNQGKVNERYLESMGEVGGGRYFYADSFSEVGRLLTHRFGETLDVVSSDVKFEIEFDSAQVKSFRSVNSSKAEPVSPNSSSAWFEIGEIGAGFSLLNLFELELKSPASKTLSSEPFAVFRISYKLTEAGPPKLVQLSIDRSDVQEIPSTSEDFRFALAVSYFGRLLKQGKAAGFGKVRELALGASSQGHRREFVQLVKKAEALQ